MTKIKYPVGKNGMNRLLDTYFIQLLLNHSLEGKSWYKSLVIDGKCGSKTITAIREYQIRILKFMHADGLIEPNRTTFTRLTKAIPTSDLNNLWNIAVTKSQPIHIISTGKREKTNSPLPERLIPIPDIVKPTPSAAYSFPLDYVPKEDFHKGGHARYFGAGRRGSKRLHAGCDLIAPVGTPVYAIADGTITVSPYYFYAGTYAIEVDHCGKIVRYGELLPNASIDRSLVFLPDIKRGYKVRKSEVIGYVGKLIGHQSSMLHIEMYAGTARGPLTDKNSGNPYQRRADIIDPTGILEGAKSHLPEKSKVLEPKLIENAVAFSNRIRAQRSY